MCSCFPGNPENQDGEVQNGVEVHELNLDDEDEAENRKEAAKNAFCLI